MNKHNHPSPVFQDLKQENTKTSLLKQHKLDAAQDNALQLQLFIYLAQNDCYQTEKQQVLYEIYRNVCVGWGEEINSTSKRLKTDIIRRLLKACEY